MKPEDLRLALVVLVFVVGAILSMMLVALTLFESIVTASR